MMSACTTRRRAQHLSHSVRSTSDWYTKRLKLAVVGTSLPRKQHALKAASAQPSTEPRPLLLPYPAAAAVYAAAVAAAGTEGRAGDGAVVGGSEGVLLFLDDESVGEAVELLGALVGVGDRDVERRGPAEEEQREDALLGLAGDEREALLLQAVPEGVDVEALGGRRAPAVERAVRCVLGAEELRRVRAVEAPGVDVRQHRHPLHRQEVHAAGALGLRALDQALHVAVRRLLKHLGRHRLAPPRVRGPRHDLVHQPLADQHPLVVVHRRRQHQPVGGAVEVQELLQAHVAHREAVHAQLRLLRQEQDALSGGPKHRLDHHLATAEQAVRLDEVVDRGAHVALGHADGRVDLLDHRGLVERLDVPMQDALLPVLLDPLELLAEDRDVEVRELRRPALEVGRHAVRHQRPLVAAASDDLPDPRDDAVVHVVVLVEDVARREDHLLAPRATSDQRHRTAKQARATSSRPGIDTSG
eukprot:642759-Rhodomonas_salina.3